MDDPSDPAPLPAAVSGDPPAVTVVVPTHERPALMQRAVQSVLDQTYPGEIEVIVVFDACDVELPVFEVGNNRSLRALPNQRTRGLAGSRNTGILAATHASIAFLDDDDYWAPTKIDEQMALMASHPTAILVGTGMVVDDGVRRHVRLLPSSVITHRDLLHSRLAGLHSSSIVVRRNALLGELGMVDEDLPRSYGEDYDLLLRAASIEPIVVVNRPLVTVSWQGESHFLGRWADYAAAWHYLLTKHPELGTNRRVQGRIEAQIAFATAASGRRGDGARWATRSLLHDPRSVRAWLALAIAIRVVSPGRVIRMARRHGRSI